MSSGGGKYALSLYGLGLMVLYTLLITCSDAITKYLARMYEAPQLLCIVALLMVLFSLGSGRIGRSGTRQGQKPQSARQTLKTQCPRAMALRSVLTVVATVMFFHALATLQLAQVFVFVALIPLLSALMSGPILGEHVRMSAWIALSFGVLGLAFMFEIDLGAVSLGHVCAMIGAVAGTASIVLARYIGRIEDNALAQVFYPQATVFVTMAFLAPMSWQPMPLMDLGLAVMCALVLFMARLLLVIALRHLAAYAVTPLMNLQFVWMVLIGILFFNEVPDASTFVGVVIVMGSGLFLVFDQAQKRQPLPLAERLMRAEHNRAFMSARSGLTGAIGR